VTVEPIAALRDTFLRRIDAHEVYIGIIGQGYVGLPLALTFIEKGFRVLGFDVDAGRARPSTEASATSATSTGCA
jgi:UDP-N-acetyl-D-glucosamine dehydrogenase